jgi:protein involved in polysaccharide export with SLBB domain
MHFGRGRSSWRAGFLASVFGLLTGCASHRTQIEQAVLANHPSPAYLRNVACAYHAHCPDVLQVDIAYAPQYSGPKRIGPDGRINVGNAGPLQVDGQTTPEIVRVVAETTGVPPSQVRVEVAEYNSQYLYLFGQVAGTERAVPFQGPETVLDLLHRVGGITPGAALRDITVVRPHVADGKAPEVFQIDLTAIVLHKDPETNIILEPYDQIHIGQSRRSSFSSCLPPWLRPFYVTVCGMKRRNQELGVRGQESVNNRLTPDP